MTRVRWIVLLAVMLLAAAALAGVAEPRFGRAADATTRTITVTGNGSVTAVPDTVSFDFTVDARATTATVALAKAATGEQAVLTAVKAVPVDSADIQTSQVALSPTTSQNGQVTGYDASVTISVSTTIARAGALVDGAVGAGATGVSGPSLTRSDESTLYLRALADAVADAEAKAKALAAASSLTLGSVQTVVEGSAAPTPILGARAAASPSVPIEPGTETIDATVTVTYAAS